jgi:hypothetical protein
MLAGKDWKDFQSCFSTLPTFSSPKMASIRSKTVSNVFHDLKNVKIVLSTYICYKIAEKVRKSVNFDNFRHVPRETADAARWSERALGYEQPHVIYQRWRWGSNLYSTHTKIKLIINTIL